MRMDLYVNIYGNIEQFNRNPNVCGMTNIFVLAWEING